MKLSDKGARFIKNWEGKRLKAYKCTAGVWTVGYGHTGPDVGPTTTITDAKADEYRGWQPVTEDKQNSVEAEGYEEGKVVKYEKRFINLFMLDIDYAPLIRIKPTGSNIL